MRYAVIALLLSSSAVQAAEFPIYDAEGDCRRQFTGSGVASCIREDQAAYDFTRAFWDELPDASQRKCADMKKPPQMKYVLLRACVQSELQLNAVARDAARPLRFRY